MCVCETIFDWRKFRSLTLVYRVFGACLTLYGVDGRFDNRLKGIDEMFGRGVPPYMLESCVFFGFC